ncbi:ATP-grasp domain-containing protein [Agitococcus lubricus]|uniref:Carbamoyl-phosphate synthase large subunit n=1 Tax=Agitococcus lubricus TaxID=1077255 RepID=A0A2T5J0W8_9GAMM|nr:ATP-grasp domain-containing protein [Agitococcus lubricus]PTQ90035.1 carbamoyl-phosphate synthase large subunit [Agitococcus lubricus]
MNILILSAGRRVSLVRDFQRDARQLLPNTHVFAADLKPHLSAACQVADRHFVLPSVRSAEYPQALLALCLAENISLVVPTIDTELLVLANHKAEFLQQGIHLVISDEALVKRCRDKRLTIDLFNEIGIDSPQMYQANALSFPCFAKPIDGSCSQNIHTFYQAEQISASVLEDPKMLFMELIPKEDYQEYTVDLYYDRQHQLKCVVPRRRIEIRGGEVSKGVTVKGAVYQYLTQRLATWQGAVGCITLQLFKKNDESRFLGIEVNPRFGGGYPLSYLAGATFPKWLIQEYLLGQELTYCQDWEDRLLMLRYDDEVLVHGFNH